MATITESTRAEASQTFVSRVSCACGYQDEAEVTKKNVIGSSLYSWVCPWCKMGHISTWPTPGAARPVIWRNLR